MSKKHQVFVVWGSDLEEGDKPTPYEFNTEEELNAFVLGVDEASGYCGGAVFANEEEANSYIEEQIDENTI